jgi:hypothetical protein
MKITHVTSTFFVFALAVSPFAVRGTMAAESEIQQNTERKDFNQNQKAERQDFKTDQRRERQTFTGTPEQKRTFNKQEFAERKAFNQSEKAEHGKFRTQERTETTARQSAKASGQNKE